MSQEVLELKAKLYDMGVQLEQVSQNFNILNEMGTTIATRLGVIEEVDGNNTYNPHTVAEAVDRLCGRVDELEDEKQQAYFGEIEQSERDSLEN